MNKHWLYYISPCILASVFAFVFTLIGFISLGQSGGYSIILVLFFLPALCIYLVLDWLVKRITKGNLLYIWIIEIILVAIGLLFLQDFGGVGVC